MIKIVATDLDRTLIPNGKQKYDGSMKLFKKIIKEKNLILIYVSGRDLNLVKKAIKKYSLPFPDYVISSVGARIFKFKNKKEIICDRNWSLFIKNKTPGWDIDNFKKNLDKINGLELQEKSKQDIYKLSYYVELGSKKSLLDKVRKKIKEICSDVKVVYSEDYPEKRGLLDVLPKIATKKGALDYLIKKLKLNKREVLFCGDSGNDYDLLVSDYNAVIVKNASKEIKDKVKEKRKKQATKEFLYIAKKQKKTDLNGNYVSGIIQGLRYFRVYNLDINKNKK